MVMRALLQQFCFFLSGMVKIIIASTEYLDFMSIWEVGRLASIQSKR